MVGGAVTGVTGAVTGAAEALVGAAADEYETDWLPVPVDAEGVDPDAVGAAVVVVPAASWARAALI